MKQCAFLLLLLVAGLQPLSATDIDQADFLAWNIIRERLFSGENTKAYRFEDDIRMQVNGVETQQDSAVFVKLVDELDQLLETVDVILVDKDPNFTLNVSKHQGGQSTGTRRVTSGYKLVSVTLDLGFLGSYSDDLSLKHLYYYTIRELTVLYTPKYEMSYYGGIFDASKADQSNFTDTDKAILRLLYSNDFYKNLRAVTIATRSAPYYLEMRYKKQMTTLSYAFKALLLLFGFLFFLSRESKRKPNPNLFQYLKQRVLILLLLPFFFIFIRTSGVFSFLSVGSLLALYAGQAGLIILCGVFVLVLLYYVEPLFLKRITPFWGKQVFVYLSTTLATMLVPTVFFALLTLLFDSSSPLNINPLSFWSQSSTLVLLIVLLAALRVFYNLITYRIQSLVNQKDVEIATMRALKNQAELNALHSRINPHFLYNALNAIASLAHLDADKTENMALGLSALFRYAINKEGSTYVTVAEELEMVKKYLDIEKTRFGERLAYDIKADESTRNQQIPKFLIQPLVENAVKHGLSMMKDKGVIVVEVKQQQYDLLLEVYDNGPDFPAEPVGGYGLQNLHDTLSLLYGNKASINWVNGTNKHIAVILKHFFES
ncbi:MAG TPA: hypothetical protein DD409_02915 [Bacteroidales bacterium]|nr:hypothetical protein [Bacteroidales bacterium]